MLVAECLVLVDLQRASVLGESAVPAADSLMSAVNGLLDRAREAAVRVVFLQNDGAPGTVDEPGAAGWELAIQPKEGEFVVHKTGDDGFEHHGFLNVLLATRLAFDGTATPEVVETLERRDGAALAAFMEGAPPFDGHKGEALTFRRWDHQLRQPLYVAGPRKRYGSHRVAVLVGTSTSGRLAVTSPLGKSINASRWPSVATSSKPVPLSLSSAPISWNRVSSEETAYKTLRVSRFQASSGKVIPPFPSTFGTVG